MLRIIERLDGDTRIEAGFFDDAERPEAPKSRHDAPRLSLVDHVIGVSALTVMIAGMLIVAGMFEMAGR